MRNLFYTSAPAIIAVASFAVAAPACAEPVRFAIPAQSATAAIPEFGRQAGLQILVTAPAVGDSRTNAVFGSFEPRDALERMLTGTGLRIKSWNGRVVTLSSQGDGSLGRVSSNALADSDPATTDPQDGDQDIVVTGFRASQAGSISNKRNSAIVRESIVADDIANFPDLNLAESLQRVPGLSISREGGEGRRINVRGMPSDFARVQLNGMEVLSNSDSPMDSRYQNKRDRSFDFNVFASELFKRVDVEKSYEAAQDEGGMAGTIDLYTPKPFDFGKLTLSTSAQLGTTSNTKDFERRFVGLVSARTDTLGILVSAAWARREAQEKGNNVYRWGTVDADDFGVNGVDISNLPQAMQDRLTSGETFYAARGNRISSWNATEYRLGITTAIQWQPSDAFHVTLDGLYGQFNQHRRETHIATQGSVSSETALNGNTGACYVNGAGERRCPGASVVNDIHINGDNEIDYLDVSNTKLDTETRIQLAQNRYWEGTLTAEWKLSDRLTAHILGGYEYSTFNKPYSTKIQTVAYGGIVTDYSKSTWCPENTYDFDTADPNNWSAASINFEPTYLTNEFANGKIDLDYRIGDKDHVRIGGARRRFMKSFHTRSLNNYLVSGFADGSASSDITPYANSFTAEGHSWTTVDVMKALDNYGIDYESIVPANELNKMRVVESTWAGYLEYDFDHRIGSTRIRGNAGLRYYSTDQDASGQLSGGYTTTRSGYDGWLPAANLVIEPDTHLQIRAAYSRNVTRNDLTSLVPSGTASFSNDKITVTAGNPYLLPYKSDNFDFGVAWYGRHNTAIGATGFYKHVTNYPGTEIATDVPWSTTGLPTDVLPGVTITPETIVTEYSRPVNLRAFNLKGIEFFAQSDLFFLPGALTNLGIIANLTVADSKVDYASAAQSAQGIAYIHPLQGMSKYTANLTLYYEDRKFGARVSGNYRSSWWNRTVPQYDGAKMMDYGDGWSPTLYVDANIHYQLTPNIGLSFDAINLTRETEKQWAQRERRILLNRLDEGSTYLFGINFKL